MSTVRARSGCHSGGITCQMRLLAGSAALCVILVAMSVRTPVAHATPFSGGTITVDTTWSGPWEVANDVVVAPGVTLTLSSAQERFDGTSRSRETSYSTTA